MPAVPLGLFGTGFDERLYYACCVGVGRIDGRAWLLAPGLVARAGIDRVEPDRWKRDESDAREQRDSGEEKGAVRGSESRVYASTRSTNVSGSTPS